MIIKPDYYDDFKCTASSCKHNCCIGWEIDIDSETAQKYAAISGAFGDRLRSRIADGDPPHFILGEKERCPFLNEKNLCEIILTLGEENLCQICTDHPRFHNELPDRIETGVGLCCEEAARLILGQKERMILLGEQETSDEIILIRNQIIALMQKRELPISERLTTMLDSVDAQPSKRDPGEWIEFLLTLERLDDDWTRALTFLQKHWQTADYSGFDRYMEDRQTEYEQFVLYLVYRHLANACDAQDLSVRTGFVVWGYVLLHAFGAAIWQKTGEFTFAQQCEVARLFSSEIEYSEENFDSILDELEWDMYEQKFN